ncbi:MAG: phosphatase PAP2 family protein [Alistipes sp.]
MWQSLLDLDRELLLALNGDGGAFWDAFFYFVTARLTWIPLYVVLLYAVWRRFGTRDLLWVVLFLGATVIADDQICNFFKHNVPKLRPTHTPGVESLVHTVRDYRGGLYGTVSAHAAISFSIALFTSVLFRRRWYAIAIFVWAALLAYSRIYLGVHYPLDILFGLLLGLSLAAVSVRLCLRDATDGGGFPGSSEKDVYDTFAKLPALSQKLYALRGRLSLWLLPASVAALLVTTPFRIADGWILLAVCAFCSARDSPCACARRPSCCTGPGFERRGIRPRCPSRQREFMRGCAIRFMPAIS